MLARPKFRQWITLTDAAAFIEAQRLDTDLRPDPTVVPKRVRDPDDDYLVGLADKAGATIVSGDADLLEAGLVPPAITPRDLIDRLGRS